MINLTRQLGAAKVTESGFQGGEGRVGGGRGRGGGVWGGGGVFGIIHHTPVR